MEKVPVWATEDCRRGIRTYACMQVYTTVSGTEDYCAESCLDALAECDSLWKLDSDFQMVYSVLAAGCGSVDTACQSADPDDLVPLSIDETRCPAQLVVPDGASLKGEGEVHWIDGSGCALRCPSIWYSPQEWAHMNIFAMVVLPISCFCAAITTMGLLYAGQKLLASYTGCTTIGLFMIIIVLGANDGMHEENHLICDGNAGYVARNPLLVGCQTIMLFVIVLGFACVFLASVRVWLPVALARKLTPTDERILFASVLWIPFAVTIALIAGEAVGYDYETQPLVPYVLFHDKEDYYWVWYSPLLALTMIQLVVSLHTVYSSTIAVVRAYSPQREGPLLETFSKAMQRNRRMVMFVVFHVLSASFVLYVALYYFGVYAPTLEDETEDYVGCLLEKGYSDPKAVDSCGDVPDIPMWAYITLNFYKVIFGCVPFAVFGTGGIVTRFVSGKANQSTKGSTQLTTGEMSSRKEPRFKYIQPTPIH